MGEREQKLANVIDGCLGEFHSQRDDGMLVKYYDITIFTKIHASVIYEHFIHICMSNNTLAFDDDGRDCGLMMRSSGKTPEKPLSKLKPESINVKVTHEMKVRLEDMTARMHLSGVATLCRQYFERCLQQDEAQMGASKTGSSYPPPAFRGELMNEQKKERKPKP